jgi:hypothetical protein
MMKTVGTSGKSVYFNQSTWLYIPEGCRFRAAAVRTLNLKSFLIMFPMLLSFALERISGTVWFTSLKLMQLHWLEDSALLSLSLCTLLSSSALLSHSLCTLLSSSALHLAFKTCCHRHATAHTNIGSITESEDHSFKMKYWIYTLHVLHTPYYILEFVKINTMMLKITSYTFIKSSFNECT